MEGTRFHKLYQLSIHVIPPQTISSTTSKSENDYTTTTILNFKTENDTLNSQQTASFLKPA